MEEAPVAPESVDRQVLQLADRGVAGAEVVKADRDPKRPQVAQGCVGGGLVEQDGLGDLQDQLGGRQATVVEGLTDLLDQGPAGQVPGRGRPPAWGPR